ncbi:TPA: hypothetical protein ACHVE4_002038 [Streptococcus suis]
MGLKYVSSDSSNLMTALEQNITQIKSEMDTLSTGANQLVLAVDGRTLSGAAYTAASGLFSECIIPAIQKTKSAVDAIQTDLSSYKTQDGTVSGEGVLDEDELNKQLTSLKSQKKSAEQMSSYLSTQVTNLSRQKGTDYASYIGQLNSSITSLSTMISSLDSDIAEVERKLKLLREFSANTSSLFTGAKEGLSVSMQAMAALSLAQINADGTYTLPPGVDASWFTKESKDFKDSFYFAVANMPKSFTEEEAAQWITDQIKKYGDGVIPFIDNYVATYGGRLQTVIQSVLQIKNGRAYLKGVAIVVDNTGVLRLGGKVLYDPLKGNGTSTKNLFKPKDLKNWDGTFAKGKDFEQKVDVEFKGFHYAKNADGTLNFKNMWKTGKASFGDSIDIKSKFNVAKGFKDFKAASTIGKIGKGLGVVSTVTSLYSNWSDNTHNGKTDWLGMGSDFAVDFGLGTSATAIGAMAGSFFLPPLGTVVGAGVGMAINIGLNWEFGNPPTTSTKFIKSGFKKFVKDPVGAINGAINWAFGG